MTANPFKDLIRIDDTHGVSELRSYLAVGGDINATEPYNGWTFVHRAVEHHNLALVEALARAGADLNKQDFHGWTPLHLAMDVGIDAHWQSDQGEDGLPFDMVRLLLSLGADPTIRNNKHKTPRDIAEGRGANVIEVFDQALAGR